MRIAVLGGGNAACAVAADLSLAGHEVILGELPQFAETLHRIDAQGGIRISGEASEGLARIHMLTTSIEQAIKDTHIILLAVPSFGHQAFFDHLAPALGPGQRLLIFAGRLGSLELARLLGDRLLENDLIIGETNTLPYGCRLQSPGHVHVHVKVKRFHVAAFPANRTKSLLSIIQSLYPSAQPARNVIETGLRELGIITHPTEVLLGPLSRNAILALDEERRAVARALDLDLEPAAIEMSAMGYRAWWSDPNAPGPERRDFQPRYLTEDIPYGCVWLSSLGKQLGISTPVCDAIITFGSVIGEKDYRREGRTLHRLGLADMGKDDILRYLETGIAADSD